MSKSMKAVQLQNPLPRDTMRPILALALACEKGSLKDAKKALIKMNDEKAKGQHFHIDEKCYKKATCFWIACEGGNLKIVKMLFKIGANIETMGPINGSPLTAAAYRGNLPLVKWLVKKGASLNNDECQFFSPLTAACFKGHLSLVKWLVKHGATINESRNRWFTPLSAACTEDSYKVVEFLLENNAHASKTKMNGESPIDDCARFGSIKSFKVIISKRPGLYNYSKHNPYLRCIEYNQSKMLNFMEKKLHLLTSSFLEISLEDKIRRLELKCMHHRLGDKKLNDALEEAIILRNRHNHLKIISDPQNPSSEISCIEGTTETNSIEEFRRIKSNMADLSLHVLFINERILSLKNYSTINAIMIRVSWLLISHPSSPPKHLTCLKLINLALENFPDDHAYEKHALKSCTTVLIRLHYALDKTKHIELANTLIKALDVSIKIIKELEKYMHVIVNETQKQGTYIVNCCLALISLLAALIEKDSTSSIPENVQISFHHKVLKRIKILAQCKIKFKDNKSMLHLACSDKNFRSFRIRKFTLSGLPNFPTIKLLIKAGCDINTLDSNYNSVLHEIAANFTYIKEYILIEIIRFFINNGVHYDVRNSSSKNFRDILKANPMIRSTKYTFPNPLNLQCICAQTIVERKLPVESLPIGLQKFVKIHGC